MSHDERAIDIRVLETGEARVLVPMTTREAEELAVATSNLVVRKRLITAIGLLDPELSDRISHEIESAIEIPVAPKRSRKVSRTT